MSGRMICTECLIATLLWLTCVTQSLVADERNGDNFPITRIDRPNVVLVMADDMGFTDIGCYGGEIKTPTLDQLAKNGLRFSQFYNTSRCCPTRAALLTGLYSHQAGIGLMTGDRGYDSYRGDLNLECRTIAEVLRTAGYRTYLSGKWHVTKHVSPKGPKHNWPLQRGFDRFYGTIIGAGSFYDPATLCRDNQFVTPENDRKYQPKNYYYSDAISDNACQYIKDHFATDKDKPFFLYVSYTSAHWPMHAPEADVKKYMGVYDQGYHVTRKKRYEQAIELGLIQKDWKLSKPSDQWEANRNQAWDIRSMEVYAAMVDRMDQGIGTIVDELKRQRAFDSTIFIYLQDNGGCAEGYGRKSNAEKIKDIKLKPMGPDTFQTRIWPPMQTRDGRPLRTGPEAMAGPADTFVAYGRGWANVSNSPFRGFKHDAYEGGISTPMIVHWPASFPKERRGRIFRQPAHLIDLMPTLIEISGADYPKEVGGHIIKPLEGVSLVPALQGKPLVRMRPLGFEHHGNCALRDGDWKVVSQYRGNQPRKWELYHMGDDRTETRDLASQYPERTGKMVAAWKDWANRVGAKDWPFANKPDSRQKKK